MKAHAFRFLTLVATLCAASLSLRAADVPTWTVIDTGLNDTFGNAGKGILDPQVDGVSGVAFGAGKFVIVGNSVGETVIRWATSTDGTTWTAHSQTIANSGTSAWQSKVHFLNNQFIFFATHAVGGFAQTFVYVSADGLTWTSHKVADGGHSVADFDASATVTVAAGGNGAQYRSTDLATWTPSPVVTDGGLYSHNDLAYGAGTFISTINGFGGQTYASTDGSTWTPIDGLAGPGGGFVASANDILLVTVSGNFYRSTDGATFSKITPTVPSGWILGAAPWSAGGRFLALSYQLSPYKSAYLASADGLTWTEFGDAPVSPVVPAGQSRGYTFIDVAYGNGKYVFVGLDTAQTLFTKTVLPLVFVASAGAADVPTESVPESQTVAAGGSATFTTSATGTIQWLHNGMSISGASSSSLSLSNVQPGDTGLYSALITSGGATTLQTAILGVSSSAKVVGNGSELQPTDIHHQNGNIFDQVLVTGAAETITADAGQITRTSFIDLNDDIVQVEFSGAGSLSLVLDAAGTPALPVNYNQDVKYVKGHAGIVIVGADETTNVSIFSVGSATAVNQALFKENVTYDGVADLAFIAIASTNGKFGGLRAADANFFASHGFTGLYAPGVKFVGPVYIGNIDAHDEAQPAIIIGSADGDTRITGGDLKQTNGSAVEVSGITQLKFTAGSTSAGVLLSAQPNRAKLVQDGADVTGTIVVNPTP